ncbi:MAG: flavodoxin family protein [Chloroflexi bacterium]|nr:flavodoxin family protein [Chloroflexota bacterium]
MNLTIVDGGHRKKGNTFLLLDLLRSELPESIDVQSIELKKHDLAYCRGCFSCKKTGECAVKDDTSELLANLKESDVILLATPTYFGDVSARLKSFIDRTLPLYYPASLKGKIGTWLVTCEGDAGAMAEHSIMEFFRMHQMTMAGGALCVTGADPDALERDDAVKAAKALAIRISEMPRMQA